MLDHRHGALLRLYHQGDQVGAAQGDEGLAAVQQGRRVEQYHLTRLGRFAADPHAHAVFLQQAAQLLDDEGHASPWRAEVRPRVRPFSSMRA